MLLPLMNNFIRIIFIIIAATITSLFVGLVLAGISETFGWTYFTGWGLAHGTIFIVFPVLMTIFIFLLGKVWPKKAAK